VESAQVRDLRLHPVSIQGFGGFPPSTTQIVGWIVGEVLRGRPGGCDGSEATPPVWSDRLSGIITPWMEKPKRAQSFVSCGETVA
jgi:hypothetical protein